MKKLVTYLGMGCLQAICLCGCSANVNTGVVQSPEVSVEEEKSISETVSVDFSDCFDGVNGCAVFYQPSNDTYYVYNEEQTDKEESPCSTFKIISTLVGMEEGILDSDDKKMGYDGTDYGMEFWNSDLTLTEAFQASCVWYYRKVVDQIGQPTMDQYLKQIGYGNCDTSEWEGCGANPIKELNGFWLASSLEISPREQTDVLYQIFEEGKYFSKETIERTKKIMQVDVDGDYLLYGKTGSSGVEPQGWFVGFYEYQGATGYFSVFVNDENAEDTSGPAVREIAKKVIEKEFIK